jgi:putative transposase
MAKTDAHFRVTDQQFLERKREGMAEYRHSAHAVFDLKYHVIWCTKYRYKILRRRVAERARDLIRQICQTRDVVIVRGAVSPDHIHLLLSAPPVLSPAKMVQYIKGRSSRNLQAEFAELRKRYWGQHMWARGYFCATVGAVDEATIKAYIESQKWAKTIRASRSPRPPSLEPALSRTPFRRLQPYSRDFQSSRILPALRR